MSDPIGLVAEVERLLDEQRRDLADVDRFRTMARGYMDERDDARLALAMARGEGWPEGWARYGLTWWSPCGGWRIYLTTRNGRPEWILGTMKGPEVQTSHPDTLAALRASRATVTP